MSSQPPDHVSAEQPHLTLGGIGVALIVNLAFSLNFIATKIVVDATAPFLAVAIRMGVVLLICLPFLRVVPGRSRRLAAYGALNGGVFLLLINISLFMTTNVSALAIAGQLSVPMSILLGVVLFRERLSARKGWGVLLAFAGVALLAFDPAIVHEVPAMLVMSAGCLAWAGGTLIQRRLGGVSMMNIQAWNGLMGLLVLSPFALLFDRDDVVKLAHLTPHVIGWFAFSAIGATIVGQGLLAWLLQRNSISAVMPMMLIAPVLSPVFATLYFHSTVTPLMVVGGLIALAGVAFISLDTARQARAAQLPPVPDGPP